MAEIPETHLRVAAGKQKLCAAQMPHAVRHKVIVALTEQRDFVTLLL